MAIYMVKLSTSTPREKKLYDCEFYEIRKKECFSKVRKVQFYTSSTGVTEIFHSVLE